MMCHTVILIFLNTSGKLKNLFLISLLAFRQLNTSMGSKGIGLTEAEKLDLQERGAIFNDSTGDREFSLKY